MEVDLKLSKKENVLYKVIIMSNFIKDQNIWTDIHSDTISSNTKKILGKINVLKIQIIFPTEQLSNKNAINCC